MNLSESANKVIRLASRVRDYYAAELPKRHPHYPLVGPDEESAPPPPEETELRDFLASLPDETIYQLTLLMYLGREDFARKRWQGPMILEMLKRFEREELPCKALLS